MPKFLKGCLIAILAGVGMIALVIFLFFSWNSYTSPVNEAGRDYNKQIQAYRNQEIESMDDVYERLEMLNRYYQSPTFSKMQGGDKTEVGLSDIKILFGEPDLSQEIEEADFGKMAYQYYYDNLTLNFQTGYAYIDEFILEDFSRELYDSDALDQLFYGVIINHQADFKSEIEAKRGIPEQKVSHLVQDEVPTRIIYQSGWSKWRLNQQRYYDDGKGKNAPEEYVVFKFLGSNERATLQLMERRIATVYIDDDTPEEIDAKKNSLFELMDEGRAESADEILLVEELTSGLGEIANLSYNFPEGSLQLAWLIFESDSLPREIKATVSLNEDNLPSNYNDLGDLEVVNLEHGLLFSNHQSIITADFIGNR